MLVVVLVEGCTKRRFFGRGKEYSQNIRMRRKASRVPSTRMGHLDDSRFARICATTSRENTSCPCMDVYRNSKDRNTLRAIVYTRRTRSSPNPWVLAYFHAKTERSSGLTVWCVKARATESNPSTSSWVNAHGNRVNKPFRSEDGSERSRRRYGGGSERW